MAMIRAASGLVDTLSYGARITSNVNSFLRQSLPRCQSILEGRIHTCAVRQKAAKKEVSAEPIKFTTSAANVRIMPTFGTVNKYQNSSIFASLLVFMVYFFYLREENDLDEGMNTHLYQRVPSVEEPTIRQAIPKMRDAGMDTTEAEARLKVLVKERKAKEEAGQK